MTDDKSLIRDFLNGNTESFDKLIHTHENWVKNMVYNIVKHQEDAEDIAQDVFVKVYFALKHFRFESEFKTWLYRIIINRVNNHFRKQKLLSWFGQELKEEMTPDLQADHLQIDKLYALTHRLPTTQRNIIMLRVYQDLPFKSISQILSISENSAKVSFHKAKQNLKQYWENSDES